MTEKNISALAVVNDEGKLTGAISVTDLKVKCNRTLIAVTLSSHSIHFPAGSSH
jgi:hypothetical protein